MANDHGGDVDGDMLTTQRHWSILEAASRRQLSQALKSSLSHSADPTLPSSTFGSSPTVHASIANTSSLSFVASLVSPPMTDRSSSF
ncbi:unnamed protein product [Linum trigynum]|uniref:Uncharacterized protein n=1 Tax=Linum trigynum TaxID=586398 RepID=A0AAV2F0L8_9ROSI